MILEQYDKMKDIITKFEELESKIIEIDELIEASKTNENVKFMSISTISIKGTPISSSVTFKADSSLGLRIVEALKSESEILSKEQKELQFLV